MSGTEASAAFAQIVTGPSESDEASIAQAKVVFFPPVAGWLHCAEYPYMPSQGPVPAVTQTKFAGNGPATSSWKASERGMLASLVNSAPPAAVADVVGLERSIVVWDRLPSIVPTEHEFGPSG